MGRALTVTLVLLASSRPPPDGCGPFAVAPDGSLERHCHGALELVAVTERVTSQSFWFGAAPPEGEITVRLELTSDRVRTTSARGVLLDSGRRYGPAQWVDARGARTPIEVRGEGQFIALHVDAALVARTTFPAVLDPWLSPERSIDAPLGFTVDPGTSFVPSRSGWYSTQGTGASRGLYEIDFDGGVRAVVFPYPAVLKQAEPPVGNNDLGPVLAPLDGGLVQLGTVAPNEHADVAAGPDAIATVTAFFAAGSWSLSARLFESDGRARGGPIAVGLGDSNSASIAWAENHFVAAWVQSAGGTSTTLHFRSIETDAGLSNETVIPAEKWSDVHVYGSDLGPIMIGIQNEFALYRAAGWVSTYAMPAGYGIFGPGAVIQGPGENEALFALVHADNYLDFCQFSVREPIPHYGGYPRALSGVRHPLAIAGHQGRYLYAEAIDDAGIEVGLYPLALDGGAISWVKRSFESPNDEFSPTVTWSHGRWLTTWVDTRSAPTLGQRRAWAALIEKDGALAGVPFLVAPHLSGFNGLGLRASSADHDGWNLALPDSVTFDRAHLAADGGFRTLTPTNVSFPYSDFGGLTARDGFSVALWGSYVGIAGIFGRRFDPSGAPIDATEVLLVSNPGSYLTQSGSTRTEHVILTRTASATTGVEPLISLLRWPLDGGAASSQLLDTPDASVGSGYCASLDCTADDCLAAWGLPGKDLALHAPDGRTLAVLGSGACPLVRAVGSVFQVIELRNDGGALGQAYAADGTAIDAPWLIPGAITELDIAGDDDGGALIAYAIDHQIRVRILAAASDAGAMPTGGVNGGTCALDSDCASGFCTDGVCCDARCGASDPLDCLACSTAGGAAVDGHCGSVASGRLCRPAADTCDLVERCDGVSTVCPADLTNCMSTSPAPAPQGPICGIPGAPVPGSLVALALVCIARRRRLQTAR